MTDSVNPRYAAIAAGAAASIAVAAYLRRRQHAAPAADGGADRPSQGVVPAQKGDAVSEVETPALLVDLDAAEGNMRLLETQCAGFPGVVVRPHIKSHKCPDLAKLQLRYRATQGLCCAKVGEVEAMASAGILDLHLANEVVDSRKHDRLCTLIRRTGAKVRVCVDNADNVAALSAAAQRHGVELEVVVEINTGQDRCGVQTPEAAADLAELVHGSPGLAFVGVQGYHGAAQHIRDALNRGEVVMGVVEKARATVHAIEARGLAVPVVTGGGTGTYPFEAGSGVYTEVQPGSYVFHDADYAKNLDSTWEHSLFVLAQVMSVNAEGGWCVVDAGLKSHSVDTGVPALHGRPDVECVNGGDEHLILKFPAGEPLPKLGSKLRLVPNHCDPTCNMHSWMVAVRGESVETVWPIHRGPGH